jgi:DNA-binding transcriptional LysR family regulator
LELRDIEIFLTLAEELHFGRTAERLHVSQARVSQAIKQQERQIGAALFERTSRRVALTAIGAQLRDDFSAGYQRIRDGIEAATTAGRGFTGTLTLGTMGALAQDIADVTDLFRARYPEADLRFRELHAPSGFAPLRTGDVDIGLYWLPVREPDLTVGPVLRARPLLLMVAVDHPLAQRDVVCMEDLGDWVVPQSTSPVPAYWEAGLQPFHTPSGRPVRRGPKIATWQETLTRAAAGDCVVPIQAEAATYYSWPGIVFLPITDAPLGEWALVWRTAGETTLIRALVQVARDTLDPADSSRDIA